MPQAKQGRTWSLGTSTTSRSFALESWSTVKAADYNLLILEKRKIRNKQTIPATEGQRLAYYRYYVSMPAKIQVMYLQPMVKTEYFWLYIKNLLFKTIPVHYLHVFLAAYSPNEHLFASKMAPLCTGVSWQVLICGLFQLVYSMDVLSLYLHYNVAGMFTTTPWNKCEKEVVKLKSIPYVIYCFEHMKFMNVTSYNKKRALHMEANFWNGRHPVTRKEIWYQSAPIVYFLQQWIKTSVLRFESYEWIAYFAILWILPALMYKSLFRKMTWKIFNAVQWFLNGFYLFSALYVVWMTFEDETERPQLMVQKESRTATGFDFTNLADSITGPPVVQLLTARSTDQINPGRDSTMIVFSNAFYYIFQAVINYQIKESIEKDYGIPLALSNYNQFPIFFYWNMFFAEFELGSITLIIFYNALFLVEFLMFSITFQIMIEVVASEWRVVRRWIASIILPVIGLTLNIVLRHEEKRYLYVFSTAISSAAELVVICWVYPISRLFDDICFQFGAKAMTLRKLSLMILPFYAIYKLYVLVATFKDVLQKIEWYRVYEPHLYQDDVELHSQWDFACTKWVWIVPVAPMVLGVFYGIIKLMVIEKQSCTDLLKPRPDWGPPDHVTRQLRKQFDASQYVGSQASRYLSRHLLAKAQTPTYRLDVNYVTEKEENAERKDK